MNYSRHQRRERWAKAASALALAPRQVTSTLRRAEPSSGNQPSRTSCFASLTSTRKLSCTSLNYSQLTTKTDARAEWPSVWSILLKSQRKNRSMSMQAKMGIKSSWSQLLAPFFQDGGSSHLIWLLVAYNQHLLSTVEDFLQVNFTIVRETDRGWGTNWNPWWIHLDILELLDAATRRRRV